MIPITLQLSGFLSYQEPEEVDFTGFNLACISGSNGAGKSSLLDAITWALFGKARQNDDSIINSHKDTARVVLAFLYEGETYRVTREKHRNKTGVLEFNIRAADGSWTVLTRESIRATEALIRETLKMEYETFINASFFLQGKADQFAQKNPAQRKEILGSILGLDRWDTYRQEAGQRARQVKSEIDALDGQLREISLELAEEDQRKQKLAEAEEICGAATLRRSEKEKTLQLALQLEATLQEHKAAVTRLENEVKAASGKRDQLNARLVELDGLIRKDQSLLEEEPSIEEQYREWVTIREAKDKMQEVSSRYHHLANRRNPLLNEISAEEGRLRQRLAQLEDTARNAQSTQAELERLTASLPERKRQLDAWQAVVDKRPQLEASLQVAQAEAARHQADIDRFEKDLEEMRDRFSRLRSADGAECPVCGQPLSADHRTDLLKDLEKEGQDLKARQSASRQMVEQKKKDQSALQESLRECDNISRQLQTGQREFDRDTETLARKSRDLQDQQAAGEEAVSIRANLETGLFAEDLRKEQAGIKAEMDALNFDETELTRLSTRESELRSVDERHRELGVAKTRLDQRTQQQKHLQSELADQEQDITRREAERAMAQQKKEELSSGLPDLVELKAELNRVRDDESSLLKKLGEARQLVNVLDEKRRQQDQINAERLDKARQLDRLKILEKAFGKSGVPALLIEEALPEIESRANEILDRLSDGTMSVQLITQKDYKDKKREDKQETLDILISDGAGERAYELFSGGEAFRVNFAIRLALSQELAHRAGARLQTLVIDEGFGSQDVDGRQRLIETINIVQQNFEKILVITHMEELKEAFPARIEVEKTARGSKVTVL